MYSVLFSVVLLATVTTTYGQLSPVCVGVQCIMGSCNVTIAGAPFCQCYDGYKPSKIINVCEDIDECKVSNTQCGNYYCCNEPGAFVCSTTPCQYRIYHKQQNNNNNLLWLLMSMGEAKKRK